MNTELVAFAIVGAVALVCAVAMITSRSAIYSALFLVLTMGAIAVLYLLLNAPFLAMVQLAVYAGAIMVLFLFVIMLLGAEQAGSGEVVRWQPPAAIALAAVLLAAGAYVLAARGIAPPAAAAPPDSSPAAVGQLLFSRYLLPFEITSIILLVAVVGAVVLTREEKSRGAERSDREIRESQ